MLQLGLGLALTHRGNTFSFDVESEALSFIDLSDTSTLFQDTAGTTPATTLSDPVARADDQSGNGRNALQSVTANRPTVGSGHVDFNGVNHNLEVTLPATQGTMAMATSEGIIFAEIDVASGAWPFTTDPDYFPGPDAVAVAVYSKTLSSGEKSAFITSASDLGAGTDFAGRTNFAVFFRRRTDITSLDCSRWNTASATDLGSFARDCTNLVELNVAPWDVGLVTNFAAFTRDCPNLTSIDVSSWDTSSVANFSSFVRGCSSLPTLDVSSWDVSSVTDFTSFSFGCSSLAPLDVSSWDTSSVTSFTEFARDCSSLTTLDLSSWDTSLVTSFASFVRGCSGLTTVTVNGGSGSPFSDSPCTNYSGAFTNTNLSQSSIDDILVAIAAAGTSSGTLNQSGGSAPSSTGEAAIDTLRGRSWTVSVTGGY